LPVREHEAVRIKITKSGNKIFNTIIFIIPQKASKDKATTVICKRILVTLKSNLINFLMPDSKIARPDSLEKKLYQLIISRLDGDRIKSVAYQRQIIKLVQRDIGGFIIFGGKKDKAKNFISTLQSISKIPLFIASDIERGVQQQIKNTTPFPCQMAVAAAIDRKKPEDISFLENAIKAIANEAKDIGINMPLIPVLDVNQNPDNPIICTRAFSDNPEDVAWFGAEYIKILEAEGLISCAKHFPGHGDTSTDSHISLPVITKSLRYLNAVDILPFAKAVKTGVSSIMAGHLSVPALDSKPSSLSGKIITGLLRKELGFKGLILTDALNMNALKDFGNVPAGCLNAGFDILLHPADADLTIKELLSAVKSKKISEDRIDASVDRILKIKIKLQDKKPVDVNYNEHKRLSEYITEKSITLVKIKSGILPVTKNSNVHLILAGDNKLYDSSPLKKFFKNVSAVTGMENLKNKTAIFSIFTNVAAWKGSSGISDAEKKRIMELIKQAGTSIVISFGSPYVLRHFSEADILIAAYDTTKQAQRAVMKCLRNEMEFKGRLPVNLNNRGAFEL
jgi:beta-glucosidase-like glycosyl hydrolase